LRDSLIYGGFGLIGDRRDAILWPSVTSCAAKNAAKSGRSSGAAVGDVLADLAAEGVSDVLEAFEADARRTRPIAAAEPASRFS
jgi:hypothetical protein